MSENGNNKNNFFHWFLQPPFWFILLIYVLTIFFCVGAILILTIEYEGTWLEILAYVLFALAATTLGYSVYTTIRIAGKVKSGFIAWAEKYEFTVRLLHDFGFRTLAFAIGSLVFSFLFGVFNGVLGIMSLSVWYGSLAAYYILMVFLRSGIILHHRNKRRFSKNEQQERKISEIKTYRNCGILIIILNLALSAAVVQMVLSEKSFSYAGLMIYATAAYAFFKITVAIINQVRARKEEDLTLQAVQNVNLADAMVSILALQTALLHAYSGEDSAFIPYANAATGGVVCLLTLAMGIFMIIRAGKRLKEIKRGEQTKNGTE